LAGASALETSTINAREKDTMGRPAIMLLYVLAMIAAVVPGFHS
jgi:hypothetical protein